MVKKLTEIAKDIGFGIKLAGAFVKDYVAGFEIESKTQDTPEQGYGLQVLKGNDWVEYS